MPEEIIKKFQKKYGDKKGKEMYYATAAKQKRDPETFKKQSACSKLVIQLCKQVKAATETPGQAVLNSAKPKLTKGPLAPNINKSVGVGGANKALSALGTPTTLGA